MLKLCTAIIRVLINFYTGNFVRVAWCGIVSDFLAINCVKQGGVLSPFFYICILMACWWRCPRQELDDYFVGALHYADDIVQIAPSAPALHIMLAICDKYANDYCISFNASKSKSVFILHP